MDVAQRLFEDGLDRLGAELCGAGLRADCVCKSRKDPCEFMGGPHLTKPVSGWRSIQALIDKDVESLFQPAKEAVSSSVLKGVVQRHRKVYASNGALIVYMVACGFEFEQDGRDVNFKVIATDACADAHARSALAATPPKPAANPDGAATGARVKRQRPKQ